MKTLQDLISELNYTIHRVQYYEETYNKEELLEKLISYKKVVTDIWETEDSTQELLEQIATLEGEKDGLEFQVEELEDEISELKSRLEE